MYSKTVSQPFFNKGVGQKIIGGIKGVASLLDEPIVQTGVSMFAPEVGIPLMTAKRLGVLEKVKNL